MKNINNSGLNRLDVLEEFNHDYPREDHYCKGNAIYRFSISADTLELSGKDMRIYLHQLLSRLYKLPIVPSRVFIYGEDASCIEIEWAAKAYQVVSSKKQYLDLALQFADFIDEQDIPDFKINTGTFNDDPEFIKHNDTKEVNKCPEFNYECFGHKVIEIENFSDIQLLANK